MHLVDSSVSVLVFCQHGVEQRAGLGCSVDTYEGAGDVIATGNGTVVNVNQRHSRDDVTNATVKGSSL